MSNSLSESVPSTIMTFIDTSPTGFGTAATGGHLVGESSVGSTYMFIVPDDPSYGPAHFFTIPSKRMRELSLEESHALRRRKLSAIGIAEHEDSSSVHFEDCLVFHCFYGDEQCEEPSPLEACLKVGDDGTCADPLCRYYYEEEAA